MARKGLNPDQIQGLGPALHEDLPLAPRLMQRRLNSIDRNLSPTALISRRWVRQQLWVITPCPEQRPLVDGSGNAQCK